MGNDFRVVIADFEGIFKREEIEDKRNSKRNRAYVKFLILISLSLFAFVLYSRVEELIYIPFPLILLATLAPLIVAIRHVLPRKRGRNEVRKKSRLELLSLSKDELRNPRSIAMELLNLYPFHKAREPSIYVVVCELSKDTVHRLIELVKHIRLMLRKNTAKLILYTYPSLYPPVEAVSELCELFDQIILYDGDINSVWNWKLYALKKAIEYCSEEIVFCNPGVAIICYNSFSVSNLNYDQLKFELMSIGIPLFSNSEPLMEKGREIVLCTCPKHLRSEIEKILLIESLENHVKAIENSDAVEVFTIYHASRDLLIEVVGATNSQSDSCRCRDEGHIHVQTGEQQCIIYGSNPSKRR